MCYWPGPIVNWILGRITQEEFRSLWIGGDKADTLDRHWQAAFYAGVLQYSKGKRSVFKKTMQKLEDTSQPEWSDETFFLARMWGAEFFLARSYGTDLKLCSA